MNRHLRSVGCAQRGVETVVILVVVQYGRATVENCIYLYCECDFDAALGTYEAISRTECESDANRSFECEIDTLSSCLAAGIVTNLHFAKSLCTDLGCDYLFSYIHFRAKLHILVHIVSRPLLGRGH